MYLLHKVTLYGETHPSSALNVTEWSPRGQDRSVLKLYTYSFLINRQKDIDYKKSRAEKQTLWLKFMLTAPIQCWKVLLGKKKIFLLLTFLIFEKIEEMNYIPIVLRGKHWFLRQHNYLLPAYDLHSLMTDREEKEKGARDPQGSQWAADDRKWSAPNWLLQKCRLY